jgi:hypothetical protein
VTLSLGLLCVESAELVDWRRPYPLSEPERSGLRSLFIKVLGEKLLTRHLHVPLMIPVEPASVIGLSKTDRTALGTVMREARGVLCMNLLEFRKATGLGIASAIRLCAELEALHVNAARQGGEAGEGPMSPLQLVDLLRATVVRHWLLEGMTTKQASRRWQVFQQRHLKPTDRANATRLVARQFGVSSADVRDVCADVFRVLSESRDALAAFDRALFSSPVEWEASPVASVWRDVRPT